MQAFGIGLPELLLVLAITVMVVGPDRLPEVAGHLARFIRRARTYAQHVARDFNEVIAEVEKEVGASRDDWKEIANAVGGPVRSLATELDRASDDARRAADLGQLDSPPVPSNVVPIDAGASRNAASREATAVKEQGDGSAEGGGEDAEEKKDEPWYVPGAPRRRRGSSDGF